MRECRAGGRKSRTGRGVKDAARMEKHRGEQMSRVKENFEGLCPGIHKRQMYVYVGGRMWA